MNRRELTPAEQRALERLRAEMERAAVKRLRAQRPSAERLIEARARTLASVTGKTFAACFVEVLDTDDGLRRQLVEERREARR